MYEYFIQVPPWAWFAGAALAIFLFFLMLICSSLAKIGKELGQINGGLTEAMKILKKLEPENPHVFRNVLKKLNES